MILRPKDTQIITSILDQDLYKLTMMQVALFKFPEAVVKHEFKLRNKNVDLRKYAPEIEEQIRSLQNLRFQPSELAWLRDDLRFIKPEFIPFLKMFNFDVSQIKITCEDGGLSIKTYGPWWQTILYEIFVLAIVNEVYFQHKLDDLSHYEINQIEEEGRRRLYEKLDIIKDVEGFQFIEFGTRRRFSRGWQESALKQMMEYLPEGKMVGTSNMYLAKEYDLTPIGTMAHEYLQAFQGFDGTLDQTQERALKCWSDFYHGDLGIALTDVINMDSFLKSFDLKNAKLFDGLRHDSGDAIIWGEKAIEHYNRLNINPKEKTLCFSDGLNFAKALDIFNHFNGRIDSSYGIGTNITNDLGFDPLNIVFKMVECQGKPVAKISDEPGKGLCKDDMYLEYLLKVHNEKPTLFERPKYHANAYS